MDFSEFVVTTVQPDAKATMRGLQGQKPQKKKRLEQPHPEAGTDDPGTGFGALARDGQVPPTKKYPPHQDGAAETPFNDGVDAWAEVQAMSADDTAAVDDMPPPMGAIASVESNESMNDSRSIDPSTAPRAYMRIMGKQREIWKPGDEDGDEYTEWFGRKVEELQKEQRWRIFQSDIGKISWKNGNIPPKFVYLDDLAAHQVQESDIPRAKICKFWPHDFGQPCNIRRHRKHIGRPAVKDEHAEGDARFHVTQLGGKGRDPYHFSGDSQYTPVRYRIPVKVAKLPEPEPEVVRPKRKFDDILDAEPNRRAHGHNQYTPKDMLVKFGAPSMAKPVEKFHNLPPLPKPNHKTKGTENPIFVEKRLIGDIAQNAREAVRKDAQKAQERALREANIETLRAALREREAMQQLGSGNSGTASDSPGAKRVFATRTMLTNSATSASAPQVQETPIDVPRELSYIERRDVENRMAAQEVRNIRNEDDVQAMAQALAIAKVKVGQQEKEISLLKQNLQAAEQEAGEWEQIAADREREVAALRADYEANAGDILELKRKNTMLGLNVDRREAELRRLVQQRNNGQ
ncbi:hypothetical protein CERZMDRAFT_94635 [Cercospora zeae-maydis SCOH1-5]|uniref:Uncharacterized protein n=1 Tax=Cercospora zeae-maydis SCOH1-5 TaxID=717836 RepID=A0A6A6FP83_9PEZI|nr:hypothetical protein CERZMDRAFT_94635 [Cercospora zeae-maydis SCOH1-5]